MKFNIMSWNTISILSVSNSH